MVELTKKIEELEQRLNWQSQVLAAHGICQWANLSDAASLLSVPQTFLKTEIENAENARLQHKKSDCIYGIHYRNIQHGENRRFQINLMEFSKLLAIPPEQRQ